MPVNTISTDSLLIHYVPSHTCMSWYNIFMMALSNHLYTPLHVVQSKKYILFH